MQHTEQPTGPIHVAGERAHPTPAKYMLIAAVLTVITAFEVGIYYVDAVRPAFLPIFLGLSAVKFALVAMFYMHLRFDSRLFGVFFFGALVLAGLIALALMTIFGVF
jgi:cytochrome c oxidase subunit 4